LRSSLGLENVMSDNLYCGILEKVFASKSKGYFSGQKSAASIRQQA
jgi:hypothetical protein